MVINDARERIYLVSPHGSAIFVLTPRPSQKYTELSVYSPSRPCFPSSCDLAALFTATSRITVSCSDAAFQLTRYLRWLCAVDDMFGIRHFS